jgi:hypothetical protein
VHNVCLHLLQPLFDFLKRGVFLIAIHELTLLISERSTSLSSMSYQISVLCSEWDAASIRIAFYSKYNEKLTGVNYDGINIVEW